MTVIDQLFSENEPSVPGCVYLPLTDVIPCVGIHGRYVKLVCMDGDDLPIEATADQRHFHLLEPYVEELRDYRNAGEGAEYPVIPLFKGNDNRWRFSWHAASRDNPSAAPSDPTIAPENDTPDRAFRMQVSVPSSLAQRFKVAAQRRGLTHTDLLLSLIHQTVA